MVVRIIIGLLLITSGVFAQGPEELEKKNGFQDIKMASLVTNYEGLEYKKNIQDEVFPEAKLYTPKKGYYESIGSLKIYDLEVKTYKDSIFEIRIITEKDPKLYKGLKKLFGEPKYAYIGNKYVWNAEHLQLAYSSYSNNKIEMVYISFLMREKLKKEKKQEVEDIADDF